MAIGLVGKGRPFFLEQGLCRSGGVLAGMEAAAGDAKSASPYWHAAHQLALEVAVHAGQPPPALADTDAMLDNIKDCITVHACHGLEDVPAPFQESESLFTEMDTQETTSRSWPLNFFHDGGNASAYTEFAALYYGCVAVHTGLNFYRSFPDSIPSTGRQGRVDRGRDRCEVSLFDTADCHLLRPVVPWLT